MGLKGFLRVGSLMMVFLFLPSLGLKIWDYLIYSPWHYKSWLVYLVIGLGIVAVARRRLARLKKLRAEGPEEKSLLHLAKERLVKGEISIEEFRQIRQELDNDLAGQ